MSAPDYTPLLESILAELVRLNSANRVPLADADEIVFTSIDGREPRVIKRVSEPNPQSSPQGRP